jgi:hypothetical protein
MVLLSAQIRIIRNILCCFIVVSLNAAELITGDEYAGSGVTFSFPVNKTVRNSIDDLLFIGALQAGAGPFALSALHPSYKQVQPLLPEKINLNNEDAQSNPLFNQGVAFLDILEATDGKRSPILVSTADLTRVYLLKEFNRFDRVTAFSTNPLLDANKQVTSGIAGLAGFRGGLRSAAIAAVTPNGSGLFGAPGSAFSIINFQQADQEVKTEGSAQTTIKVVYTLAQFSLTPFGYNSPTVMITDPVVSMTNNVAIEFNRTLQLAYIGLQLVGNDINPYTDGARSLLIASVNTSGIITLRPFAPASAFDDAANQMIGGLGALINLSVQSINGMETSTGLSYVIIQGGNGSPEETQNSVYALPVINARNRYGAVIDPTIHGVLASATSPVYTYYDGFQPSRFIRRRFVQPATTSAETPRSTDPAVQVGGGMMPQGTIQAVNVVYDAVIISVSEGAGYYEPCKTGMFISRALFSSTGAIKAWTPWERVGGVAEQVFRSEISIESGNITYFTGADASSINTISRTQWGLGSNPGLNSFANQINNIYPATNGGVQGLVDVPFGTPGLNGVSMAIVGGNTGVTLTELGVNDYANGNQPCPHTGGYDTNAIAFQDGTISTPIPSSTLMLTLQGGALDNVGPVVTAAIGTSSVSNEGYLFVGGSYGLAVLTAPNGAGWSLTTGLGPNFAGLTTGMAFKTLGNYSFVRNLIVDGNFLYVVSATRVDRIDLTTAPTFTATTVASQASLVFDPNDTILDGFFSGKLGVLATSKGVFRTSNGNDVSAITTDDNKYWTTLAVPSGIVPPQHFFVTSTTGNPTDVATEGPGGMVHLLSAYLGSNRARVNRFTINNVSTAPIDDNTIVPMPDGEVEGFNGSFITFNGFRSTYTCDGALSLHSLGRALLVSPYVRTRSLRTGAPAPLDNSNGTLIGQVLRSSTSGSWLVAGDFGIRINE